MANSMSGESRKPKVVLVNPAWKRRTGAMLAAMPDLYPPMGLGCIAAALRGDGFPVEILDMPILRMAEDDDEALMDLIEKGDPGIVGFTTVTMTYPTVRRQAQLLRAKRSDLPILVGGVHVTDAPELPLSDSCFDYSVAGEGEMPVITICRGIYSGHVKTDIPGVGYHLVEKPYCNPRADMDIADYPPTAYDLFDLPAYLRDYQRMSIMTQRGCNARCIFCSSGFTMPRVKYLPKERVFEELTLLVEQAGFKYINIYDSNFTSLNSWVHAICDEIIKRDLKFQWRCFSKTNGVNLELFQKMRAAGCTHVLFGVESSHDTTLKLINKGNRRRHIEAAFAYAAEAGLNRVAYSIVGLPGETREMVMETIEFLEEMDAEWNVVSPISLMPGTPLYDRMTDYRMVIDEADWSRGSQGSVTASNSILRADEIEELCHYAFERLNKGRQAYEWHRAVEKDPGTCPHISMMSLIDKPIEIENNEC